GNVSKGAQEIYDLLPVIEADPEQLRNGLNKLPEHGNSLIKVVFHEQDMFEPVDLSKAFNLQDYFSRPDQYKGKFDAFLDKLSVLVNCIYWTKECPMLVTKDKLQEMYSSGCDQKLKVIGDISCDIEGSVEATLKATDLDNPVFVYDPESRIALPGVKGRGPVIMSIENLPCEIPVEASEDFSKVLVEFLPALSKTDLSVAWDDVELVSPIKRAMIVHNGILTPDYEYIENFLNK
ncbi:hypothetical protein K8T06_05625, partial [bacterium]|nr:hypothetical protein [bacterium]